MTALLKFAVVGAVGVVVFTTFLDVLTFFTEFSLVLQ